MQVVRGIKNKTMNKLHLLTIVLFSIALALYTVSATIAIGVGILGFIFELMAWASWFKAKKETKNEE